jgi:type II secretory pathway pseudopilin PulG
MVELMTVCMIIAILSAISFALLSRMRSQAVDANALQALNTLATGYEMYYFENHSYPQWGPGEEFASPWDIWKNLTRNEFIPKAYNSVDYNPVEHNIYGFTEDYAVEILERNASDPLSNSRNSYFIVFHPYNFQHDALAIGNNPPTGWVAVRARRGKEGGNYKTFNLYVFKRLGS